MSTVLRPVASRSLPTPARPLATLPLRPHLHSQSQCLNATRTHTTQRRARKMNNIAPAPTMGGPSPTLPTAATGRSRTVQQPLPEHDHIIYNPPPSAPNVYHTPPKFVPKSDIRWKLWQQQQAQEQAQTSSSSSSSTAQSSSTVNSSPFSSSETTTTAQTPLPPPVTTPYQKAYHLTPTDFEAMRSLKREDEDYWTRSRLAQRFQCTQLFAAMVCKASPERLGKLKREKEEWEDWARRKNPALLKIREDRLRRKAGWTYQV